MAMRIAMRWNQHPDWFHTLDQPTKIKVLAEYRLYCESPDERRTRQERIKTARMESMISKRMQ